MTAPVTGDRGAGRGRAFVAIVVYTLQSCFPPKRWAAVLAAVRRRAPVRAARPRRRRAPPSARSPTSPPRAIFGLVMPIAALVIGDAVLGAEVRAGTFHFTWLSPAPTWQIVLGRWLGGSLVALVTIAPAAALAAVVAGVAGERRAGVRRRGRRRRRPTSRCSSPSAASPGAPRCGRWRSCSSSSGCSAPPSPASPSSRRRGSRGRSSSASSTTRRADSSATGIPQGGGAVVRLADRRPSSRSPSPPGGCATCASPAPPTDTGRRTGDG